MFDLEKYMGADFKPRTEEVPVPNLKLFFDEDEKPTWKIRNLTAIEIAKSKEAMERNGRALSDYVAELTYAQSNSIGNIASDIKKKIEDMVPPDIVQRYEILMMGSVEPEIKDKSMAIYFAANHAQDFNVITNKIWILSGKGAMPGKQEPCGETPELGQA